MLHCKTQPFYPAVYIRAILRVVSTGPEAYREDMTSCHFQVIEAEMYPHVHAHVHAPQCSATPCIMGPASTCMCLCICHMCTPILEIFKCFGGICALIYKTEQYVKHIIEDPPKRDQTVFEF